MKRTLFNLFALLIVLSLTLTACGGGAAPATEAPVVEAPAVNEEPVAATEAPAAAAEEVTVTIGFTASQTGAQEVSSKRQVNGFNLWMNQVNEAGGLTLSDGTVVKFAAQSYDDESTKERVQELYTRLITEDNADFLISPYSSGLTAAAAVIAEQNGKLMITTGAADDDTYKQGYTGVFQLYTPGSLYLTSTVDMLKTLDPAAKIAIVNESDKFSTAVVGGLKPYAEAAGFEIVLEEAYASDTADFGPIINKIVDSGATVVLGGGHYPDGSTFARQLYERKVGIQFIALLVAPPDSKFSELGDAALGVTGPSQWEAKATHTEAEANGLGIEWFGPSGEEFSAAFEAAYGDKPTYHAAGGYTAGLLLEKAIRDADSIDSEAVKAALDATNIFTFYGGIKFDTSAEAHGLQIGHSMVVIQWQKNEAGELVREVVWPADVATKAPIFPITTP
ncbi:amino acid ABC transporter substrate-binding protein [Candidatus Villigracilis saccharophilus]|uniref:amino acid ABC transporter substrate-binding protein n=1 Tax=Candidatus Villigracilis saccharophilus TaxID=3140684 RepID=UPI003134F1C8|nr:amino acid ABC transporter substrate-binding protein [Anaerolineales bacterium]